MNVSAHVKLLHQSTYSGLRRWECSEKLTELVLEFVDYDLNRVRKGKLNNRKLRAWQRRAVDASAVMPCEWHHTSGAANETDYYDPADFSVLDPADYPPVKVAPAAGMDYSRLRITIRWRIMVGGFTRHAKSEWADREILRGVPDVRKDGRIVGTGGRKLSSKNEEVIFYYLPPRCRKWREITFKELCALGYEVADCVRQYR